MSDRLIPVKLKSATLDEEVLSVVFPSGLRVFHCPKPGFRKRYACYATYYGSVDSAFELGTAGPRRVPDGIAHFLEHTLFETEEGNVSDLFSRNGAYNNAATSFTTTSYLFACTERFYPNLELLIRFVENPVFDPAKVEKEKGIIEQEIRGYDDSPAWVGYMGLLENLFAQHPIRIDIAGTAESIRAIDSESLHLCYRAFYQPENMILFVVGDLDSDELIEFVRAQSRWSQNGDPAAGKSPVRRIYPAESETVFRSETRRAMEVAVPKLFLGFKETGVPESGESYLRRELAAELGLEMLLGSSSDLYRTLYEKHWILDDFSAGYGAGAGIGYALIEGDTPQPDLLRDAIVEAAREVRAAGLDKDSFERGKRRFLGGFIRGFNSLEYIANHFTYYRFHDLDLFSAVDVLAAIDYDEVEERLRQLLNPDSFATFVVEPR